MINDYIWQDAVKFGLVAPTPIMYDNMEGRHVGTNTISTTSGFWLHTYEDVEISFIPTNPIPEIEPSLYWDLSLFAKEDNLEGQFDDSFGSEIIVGIHEDADNAFSKGEDQEILPLEPLINGNIIEKYGDPVGFPTFFMITPNGDLKESWSGYSKDSFLTKTNKLLNLQFNDHLVNNSLFTILP